MSLRQQLQGTGVALVTPFTSDLKVDFDSLGNVIDTGFGLYATMGWP